MSEKRSLIQSLGGPRRATVLLAVFILCAGFYRWQTVGSGNALRQVADELGLQYEEVSQRRQLRGRIGDIGVAVDTTTENSAGDTRWYTDFKIYAPDQPYGRIVAAGFREKLIGKARSSEWLSTGDGAFDEAVLVTGEADDLLARLDADSRPAVLAAAEAGWELDGVTWQARESGRLTSAEKIRSILEVGLAAARAMRAQVDSAASPPAPDGTAPAN